MPDDYEENEGQGAASQPQEGGAVSMDRYLESISEATRVSAEASARTEGHMRRMTEMMEAARAPEPDEDDGGGYLDPELEEVRQVTRGALRRQDETEAKISELHGTIVKERVEKALENDRKLTDAQREWVLDKLGQVKASEFAAHDPAQLARELAGRAMYEVDAQAAPRAPRQSGGAGQGGSKAADPDFVRALAGIGLNVTAEEIAKDPDLSAMQRQFRRDGKI